MKIRMGLSPSSIEAAIKQLEDYKDGLDAKRDLLVKRLAEYGKLIAQNAYDRAEYDGQDRNAKVDVEPTDNGYRVIAKGETVLILEFGAGITYSNPSHPLALELGFGPGTYPGQTHAFNPKGWYIPKAAGGGHTYGNPPSKAMYNTAKDLHSEITQLAREVFRSNA